MTVPKFVIPVVSAALRLSPVVVPSPLELADSLTDSLPRLLISMLAVTVARAIKSLAPNLARNALEALRHHGLQHHLRSFRDGLGFPFVLLQQAIEGAVDAMPVIRP